MEAFCLQWLETYANHINQFYMVIELCFTSENYLSFIDLCFQIITELRGGQTNVSNTEIFANSW